MITEPVSYTRSQWWSYVTVVIFTILYSCSIYVANAIFSRTDKRQSMPVKRNYVHLGGHTLPEILYTLPEITD